VEVGMGVVILPVHETSVSLVERPEGGLAVAPVS